jgi:hypothetical protein
MSENKEFELSKPRRLKIVEILNLQLDEELDLFYLIESLINMTPLPKKSRPLDIETSKLALKQCLALQKTLSELPRFSEMIDYSSHIIASTIVTAKFVKNGITHSKHVASISNTKEIKKRLKGNHNNCSRFLKNFTIEDLENETTLYFQETKKLVSLPQAAGYNDPENWHKVPEVPGNGKTTLLPIVTKRRIKDLSEAHDELKNIELYSATYLPFSEYLADAAELLEDTIELADESKKLDLLIDASYLPYENLMLSRGDYTFTISYSTSSTFVRYLSEVLGDIFDYQDIAETIRANLKGSNWFKAKKRALDKRAAYSRPS